MRLTRALTITTLIAGVTLTGAPAQSTPTNPVDSWSGSLTTHVSGYPSPGEAGANVLAGGDVKLNAQDSRLTGTVRLGGAVDPSSPGRLVVQLGALTDGRCVGASRLSSDLGGEMAAGVSVAGDAVTFDVAMPLVRIGETYDCFDADLYRRSLPEDKTSNDVVLTDRMSGTLAPTMLTSAIEVLPVQKVKVRDGATTAWVSVRNTGELTVNELTLSGSAKGVSLGGQTTIPVLEAGRTATFAITVKLAKKKAKATVPLTITAGEVNASSQLAIARVKRAELVRPGTYRSADKRVRITVGGSKNRRWISKVTARPTETCQGSTIEFGERISLPVSNRIDLWVEGSGDGYVWDQRLDVRFTKDRVRGVVLQDAGLLVGCTAQVSFSARRR